MTESTKQYLTTTATTGLSWLGKPGQRSYELILQSVTQRLTPEHAALFAEPVTSEKGDQVDWYTDLPGEITPMADLSPDLRSGLQARLAALMDDIAAQARLLADGDANMQRLGEALSNALSIPDESAVFALSQAGAETQPVLINWASVQTDHGGVSGKVLTGWTPQRPAPFVAPAVAVQAVPVAGGATLGQTGWRWLSPLLWLLAGLLGLLFLILLIAPCALRGLPYLNFCPAPIVASDPQQDLARDRNVLENRVAFLEREIAQGEAGCRASVPMDDQALNDGEMQRRLVRERASRGDTEIGLMWNSQADLDLHVTCPAGGVINFSQKHAPQCGGRLDVDMNAAGSRHDAPVEHVYFKDPPAGPYTIKVVFFDSKPRGGSQRFRLRVSFRDDVEEFSGTLDRANPTWSTTYEYAP